MWDDLKVWLNKQKAAGIPWAWTYVGVLHRMCEIENKYYCAKLEEAGYGPNL